MSDRNFKNSYNDFIPSQMPLVNESFIRDLIHKYVKTILHNTDPRVFPKRERGDIYVGFAGIAFLFLKIAKSPIGEEFPALELAKIYADAAEETVAVTGLRKYISLLSGNAGIHVVNAAIVHAMGKSTENQVKSLLKGLEIFSDPDYLDDGYVPNEIGSNIP
jgi:hypothetical protein